MDRNQIDALLVAADQAWTVPAMTEAVMKIMTQRPRTTFQDIERWLRELDSRVYLIAKPKSEAPAGMHIRRPPSMNHSAQHWVWFCLNGETEMHQELIKLCISRAENVDRLQRSGVLVTTLPR